jgi:tripartite-type tricarboxylate transporter receptor subunit TctC
MLGGCKSMQSQTVTTSEKYPDKPITLIVPFSAGGGLDLVAREMEKLAIQNLGQSLIIVNKPGGSGTIGWNELASANPDGYTLGMTSPDIMLPSLYGPTKYNYPTAIEPLVRVTSTPFIMVIQAEQPWQTVDDVVTFAKKHPGQLKFGHSGIGSYTHVVGETFAHITGVTIEQVPFRGASEYVSALLGRHIEIIFTNPATVREYVKNGTLRVLAVTGQQRINDPVFAQIPTFKEQGFDIGFNLWYGVAVPKELPVDIKTKLIKGLRAIITNPQFKKDIETMGMQIDYLGLKESQLNWITESEELSKDVQKTGIADLIESEKQ